LPAYGNHELDKGYKTASALTKYRAVKQHATLAETVTGVAATTDIPFGIAQNEVTTTELARQKGVGVRSDGISEMEIGAAVTRGQEVGMDAVGRAIPLAGVGSRGIGVAIEGGTTSGNRIPVRLNMPGRVI